MNKGKNMIWSASAMMANTIAARKPEPGEIVMVSSATAVLPSWCMPILNRSAYGTAPDNACASLQGGGQVHDCCAERIAQDQFRRQTKESADSEEPPGVSPILVLSPPLAAEYGLPGGKAEGAEGSVSWKLRLDLVIALFRCRFPSCICARPLRQSS